MESRANYALIGAIILLATAALFAVIVWMGQVQFNREYEEYDVVFDGPVNGLSEGAAVRYLGLKVGEVEALSIDPGNDARVVARIRIDAKTPVRTDSTAILDFAGLTGATFIQIQPGSQTAPLVEGIGRDRPVITTEPTQLASLVTGGQAILSDASTAFTRINTVLSDDNVDNFSNTLRNLETLTGQLAEEGAMLDDISRAAGEVEQAAKSISEAAEAVTRLAETGNETLSAMSGDISQTLETLRARLSTLEDNLSGVAVRATDFIERIEPQALSALNEYRILAGEAQGLIADLDRLAREIERNPQAFVTGDTLPTRR